jgi:thiosulfate/3-mercaptopyruvate sulfurtransferase
MRFAVKLAFIALAFSLGLSAASTPPASSQARGRAAHTARPFQPAQLIEPAQLVKQMAEPKGVRPVILHVGFEVLYVGGHIPGAIYAGPASRPAGLEKLRQVAGRIPRNREVVIYCGCCPMKVCPNIHPAYAALEKMGFRRLLVLDLPNDFAKDWAEKGLPMVKGSAPR